MDNNTALFKEKLIAIFKESDNYDYKGVPRTDVMIKQILEEYIPEAAQHQQAGGWDDAIKKYTDKISFELGEVRYVIIPLLNWLKENYPWPVKDRGDSFEVEKIKEYLFNTMDVHAGIPQWYIDQTVKFLGDDKK